MLLVYGFPEWQARELAKYKYIPWRLSSMDLMDAGGNSTATQTDDYLTANSA